MYNLKTNHTNRLDVHDMIGNINDDIAIDCSDLDCLWYFYECFEVY